MHISNSKTVSNKVMWETDTNSVPLVPGTSVNSPTVGNFERFGIGRNSSVRSRSELPSDLREMLETEQKLSQRLRDSYEVLKKKYQELQEEYGSLNSQLLASQREKLDLELEHRKDIEKVSGELKEKVDFLESEQEKSLHRFEDFKSGVKTELRNHYASVLEGLSSELHAVKSSFGALSIEKAQLEIVVRDLNQQIEGCQNRWKQKLAVLERQWDEERRALIKRIQGLSGTPEEDVHRTSQESEISRLTEKLSRLGVERATESERWESEVRRLETDSKCLQDQLDTKIREGERWKLEYEEMKREKEQLEETSEKGRNTEEGLRRKLEDLESKKEVETLQWERKVDRLEVELEV